MIKPEATTQLNPPTTSDLANYFADRPLMWRNICWITVGHFGTALTMTIIEPMMNLRLKAVGVGESSIGIITSANLWAVSFLVMYFSWKSDHCTSKLGRRTPYVLFALPFVVSAIVLFPFFSKPWVLIALMVFYYYFNDMKLSTYPLLSIDCVPREVLARVAGIVSIVISGGGFLSARLGARMADVNQTAVFIGSAIAMAITTLIALYFIKEPPIYHPAEGKFNPLAPIKIALRDKRIVVLMIAVALLNAFYMIFKTWVWFYAKSKLSLTIGGTGAAISWGLLLQIVISYPAGWLIDKFGSYVALCIHWLIMLTLMLFSSHVTDSNGLVVLTVLFSLLTPLQVAGDTILWKTMDKADTGSYTSTVALIRNFCTGTFIVISGFIIKWTGSYLKAFWFGFALTSLALIVFFVYRQLMRSSSAHALPAPVEA